MDKLKSFFRRACEPVPLWVLFLFSLVYLIIMGFCWVLFPSARDASDILESICDGFLPPGEMLSFYSYSLVSFSFFMLPLSFFVAGCLCSLVDSIKMRCNGKGA